MNTQDERDMLCLYLSALGSVLGIEPREAKSRIREACDRSRPFYGWFLADYDMSVKMGCIEYLLEQKRARMRRLGIWKDNGPAS